MGKVLFAGMPAAVNESVVDLVKSQEFQQETASVMSSIMRDKQNVTDATETILEAVKTGIKRAVKDEELTEVVIQMMKVAMVAASNDEEIKANLKQVMIEVFSDREITSALVGGGMSGVYDNLNPFSRHKKSAGKEP